MEDVLERARLGKMNKKAKAKHLAKREKEAEAAKFKEELERAAQKAKKDEREAKKDAAFERLTTGPMFKTRKKKGG